MTRHKNQNDAQQSGASHVQTLSNAPLEAEPTLAGHATSAAAAAITPTFDAGLSRGAEQEQERAVAAEPVKHVRYRVLADHPVNSGGTRVIMRAGKELDPVQYNIRDLKAQGVKLEEY